PPPPPAPPRQRGSALARYDRARATADETGYDGSMGQPPPPAAAEPPAPPVSTGTAAAIPLEAPVRVTADPATNSIVVSATPADWGTLHGVISDLDIRRRQVFVEAIVLEATIDKTRALGFDLQAGAQIGNSLGFGQVNLGSLAPALANPTSLPGL